MAYKEIILHSLYMPSYFLGAFTEYPQSNHLILWIGSVCQWRFSHLITATMSQQTNASGTNINNISKKPIPNI